MNTALLLIEFQNDYFPNGRIPLDKSIEVSAKAQNVLRAYRERKLTVVHVQHISTHPNASSLLPCTKGAEFYSNLAPQKGEMIIKKHYPNSFKDTALLNYLIKNQVNHLIICGMMTHMAVEATVRAAHDLGFSCTVLHDACEARQLEFNNVIINAHSVHYAFLGALHSQYATVLSSDEFLQKIHARFAITEMTAS